MRKLFFTILFLTTAILIIGFNTANAAANTTLDFDGTSDYLVAPDNSVFDQANRLSISVWIQPDNTPGNEEYIVYRFNDYYLKMDTSRKIIASVHTDAETMTSTSAITCDGSTWTHIEMTYDKDAGGTDELKIYINGVLDAVGDYSTANAVSAELLYIGAADLDGVAEVVAVTNWFDGKIDDVRLYQYARSASDVRLDYNDGLAVRMGGSGTVILSGSEGSRCATDPAACMDYGLVGHWNMDEAGGDTLYDQSDNGNDGTLGSSAGADTSDPKWIGGQTSSQLGGGLASTALSFDGKDDYVDCGNDSSFDITDAITIEVWVKLNVLDTGDEQQIISKENMFQFYFAKGANAGKLNIDFIGPGTFGYTSAFASIDAWYHLVGIYDKDGGSNNMKIYVNGVVEKEGTKTGVISITANDLFIGKYNSREYFNGSIDGVKIYNRALSAEEVRYHYNRGGPVAHWKFDEGEGATAYDESGNRNHGVLTGSTSGTADSGSTTTLVDSALTQAEDFWNTYTLKIVTTTDALAPQGETATITGFAAGTDTLTFAALTAAVAADDTYKLYYGDEDGPTWVQGNPSTGQGGSALSFDGTDDYIDCGSDSSLDITSAITISAWVKVDSLSTSRYILQKDNYQVAGILFQITSDGKIQFYTSQSGAYQLSETAIGEITTGIWYHVVITRSGTVVKIYKNSVDVTNVSASHTDPASSVEPTRIGISYANAYAFNGSIDDVKIYNYARTPAQILIDYNAGLGTHIK